MMRRCRACDRHSDDLYEINGWQVCFSCTRTKRFWEMLRESLTAVSATGVGGSSATRST